jgi:hypothetical protein
MTSAKIPIRRQAGSNGRKAVNNCAGSTCSPPHSAKRAHRASFAPRLATLPSLPSAYTPLRCSRGRSATAQAPPTPKVRRSASLRFVGGHRSGDSSHVRKFDATGHKAPKSRRLSLFSRLTGARARHCATNQPPMAGVNGHSTNRVRNMETDRVSNGAGGFRQPHCAWRLMKATSA